MSLKSTTALVCAGGGAHGAYQVGVLKYIHEKFSIDKQSPFQIFAGSSCGSLNTSFYAAQSFDAHASRLWLEELWLGFHVPGYHGNILKNVVSSLYKEWKKKPSQRHAVWSLLDSKPMQDVIKKGFPREHLEKSLRLGSTLGIGVAATELLSGRTCWFVEGRASTSWNLFHSLGIQEPVLPCHVEASCSVPVFMPPVKIGGRYFLDGSISLDRPFSAALIMGATKILSIGTDKPFPDALPEYIPNFKPRITNVIRLMLNRLGHDAAASEATQIDMFNRFSRALDRKHRHQPKNSPIYPLFHRESHPSHYHTVEICSIHPSKRIRQVSGILEIPKETYSHRHRTRFMFHEKFIRELIGLGYEDAKAKHEMLSDFFLKDGSGGKRWFVFGKEAA